MKNKKQSTVIVFWITLLTGLGLLYIGIHFCIDPLKSEAGYGIHTNTSGDFSFHYIKGIRDFFSGLILIILLLAKEFRALGIILLCAVIIPATDFCIVIAQPHFEADRLYAHLIAVIITICTGIYYLQFISKDNNNDDDI